MLTNLIEDLRRNGPNAKYVWAPCHKSHSNLGKFMYELETYQNMILTTFGKNTKFAWDMCAAPSVQKRILNIFPTAELSEEACINEDVRKMLLRNRASAGRVTELRNRIASLNRDREKLMNELMNLETPMMTEADKEVIGLVSKICGGISPFYDPVM